MGDEASLILFEYIKKHLQDNEKFSIWKQNSGARTKQHMRRVINEKSLEEEKEIINKKQRATKKVEVSLQVNKTNKTTLALEMNSSDENIDDDDQLDLESNTSKCSFHQGTKEYMEQL